MTVEIAFFSSNIAKIEHGAWLSLAIGLVVAIVMINWRRGQEIVTRNRVAQEGPLDQFLDGLASRQPPLVRVPGVAVFLCRDQQTTPLAMRADVQYTHTLHEKVVIVSVDTVSIPHVEPFERCAVEVLGHGMFKVFHLTTRIGYHDALSSSPTRSRSPASKACLSATSTSSTPPTSSRGSRSPQPTRPSSGAGASTCSSQWPATRPVRSTTSGYPAIAPCSSGPKSSSKEQGAAPRPGRAVRGGLPRRATRPLSAPRPEGPVASNLRVPQPLHLSGHATEHLLRRCGMHGALGAAARRESTAPLGADLPARKTPADRLAHSAENVSAAWLLAVSLREVCREDWSAWLVVDLGGELIPADTVTKLKGLAADRGTTQTASPRFRALAVARAVGAYRSVRLRVGVAVKRDELDRALAGGVDPDRSPELALRAARLVRYRDRRSLARCLRLVLGQVEGSRRLSA